MSYRHDEGKLIVTADADRLLQDVERNVHQARLALHMIEDAGRYTVDCGDTDGDGDCPRCLTRTGFPAGEPQHWRCSRVQDALRADARNALGDATVGAMHAADDLAVYLGEMSPREER